MRDLDGDGFPEFVRENHRRSPTGPPVTIYRWDGRALADVTASFPDVKD